MNATCETCRWWDKPPRKDQVLGQCRRRPPVWHQGIARLWPTSMGIDWCGEHQPKEPTP